MARRDAMARPEVGSQRPIGLPATNRASGLAWTMASHSAFTKARYSFVISLASTRLFQSRELKVKDLPSFMITFVRKDLWASRPGSKVMRTLSTAPSWTSCTLRPESTVSVLPLRVKEIGPLKGLGLWLYVWVMGLLNRALSFRQTGSRLRDDYRTSSRMAWSMPSRLSGYMRSPRVWRIRLIDCV